MTVRHTYIHAQPPTHIQKRKLYISIVIEFLSIGLFAILLDSRFFVYVSGMGKFMIQ